MNHVELNRHSGGGVWFLLWEIDAFVPRLALYAYRWRALRPCLTFFVQKACICAAPARLFDAAVEPTFPFSSLCGPWLPLAAMAMRCVLAVGGCCVPCHGCSRPLRRWCPALNVSACECRNTSQGIRQALLPLQGLHHTQSTTLARRTLADVYPGHPGHEVLRTFLRLCAGRRPMQGRPGFRQLTPIGVGQEAIVADALEPFGQNMLQQPRNARVANGRAVDVAAQVRQHLRGTTQLQVELERRGLALMECR